MAPRVSEGDKNQDLRCKKTRFLKHFLAISVSIEASRVGMKKGFSTSSDSFSDSSADATTFRSMTTRLTTTGHCWKPKNTSCSDLTELVDEWLAEFNHDQEVLGSIPATSKLF